MPLDAIPSVSTFLWTDLKTGSCIIASLGIAHPLAYGCTLCQSVSYLLISIWSLVVGYCAVSIILLLGIFQTSSLMVTMWIWYTIVFIVVMIILMVLLTLAAAAQDQRSRVVCAILGIVWYLFSIYFVFVVNSYRKIMHH